MSAVRSEPQKGQEETSVSVSEEELRVLEMVRTLKRKRVSVARRKRLLATDAPFAEALVIARSAEGDDLKVEVLRVRNGSVVSERKNFLSKLVTYATIDAIKTADKANGSKMKSKDKKRGFLGSLIEQFASARASHKRARAIIAKYDETNAETQKALQRSRELVPHLDI